MADNLNAATRRKNMKAVRTSRTDPEERLAAAMRAIGLRFRLRNDPRIAGKPDFVFKSRRLAVFVDGDFWHGRDWFENGRAPKTNPGFWISKFERNRDRDERVNRALRRKKWSVLRLWGSDVRRDPVQAARRVRDRIRRIERERGG